MYASAILLLFDTSKILLEDQESVTAKSFKIGVTDLENTFKKHYTLLGDIPQKESALKSVIMNT